MSNPRAIVDHLHAAVRARDLSQAERWLGHPRFSLTVLADSPVDLIREAVQLHDEAMVARLIEKGVRLPYGVARAFHLALETGQATMVQHLMPLEPQWATMDTVAKEVEAWQGVLAHPPAVRDALLGALFSGPAPASPLGRNLEGSLLAHACAAHPDDTHVLEVLKAAGWNPHRGGAEWMRHPDHLTFWHRLIPPGFTRLSPKPLLPVAWVDWGLAQGLRLDPTDRLDSWRRLWDQKGLGDWVELALERQAQWLERGLLEAMEHTPPVSVRRPRL